jgi:N-terminal domain of NWD NACHT-NTPase
LLQHYEDILSAELIDRPKDSNQNIIAQKDPKTRRFQMDQLLKAALEKAVKLTKIEITLGSAVGVVLSIKEPVGSALQPVPVAAFAWTGVCYALVVCHLRTVLRESLLL